MGCTVPPPQASDRDCRSWNGAFALSLYPFVKDEEPQLAAPWPFFKSLVMRDLLRQLPSDHPSERTRPFYRAVRRIQEAGEQFARKVFTGQQESLGD